MKGIKPFSCEVKITTSPRNHNDFAEYQKLFLNFGKTDISVLLYSRDHFQSIYHANECSVKKKKKEKKEKTINLDRNF